MSGLPVKITSTSEDSGDTTQKLTMRGLAGSSMQIAAPPEKTLKTALEFAGRLTGGFFLIGVCFFCGFMVLCIFFVIGGGCSIAP